MPPVNQGSRGGLITAVVVFTIGFVTSTIFAIYYGAEVSKAQLQQQNAEQKLQQYVADINSPAVQAILAEAGSKNISNTEKTALGVAIRHITQLSQQILGSNVAATQPTSKAIDAAVSAISDARRQVPDASITDDLIGAINELVAYAVHERDLANSTIKGQGDTTNANVASLARLQAESDAKDAQLRDAAAARQSALDAAQQIHVQMDQALAKAAADRDTERQAFNSQLHEAERIRADAEKQRDQFAQQVTQLQTKLIGSRPTVVDPVVRHPDGIIASVGQDGVVYLNLGRSDHLIPGMTFEVYDQHERIPPLGDGLSSDNMPVGLGSIEVQHIGETTSQCRVVKLQPGAHIHEGDLVGNLVYDVNYHPNFIVFGKFDVTNPGHPSEGDKSVIESLVKQWGGHLKQDLNLDVDFIVMGTPPEVKEYSQQELANDTVKAHDYLEQKTALDKYNSIVTQAKDLHIPIMNQNRFLYLVGYFDLASR